MEIGRAPQDLSESNIRATLTRVAHRYPPEQIPYQLEDVDRITYHIRLATSRTPAQARQIRIADIGGGIGLFSVGCAALGMSVDLVDDFGDAVNERFDHATLPVHAEYGVRYFRRDAVREGFHAPDEKFDIVTSFDSVEHWHRSPKRLFREIAQALVPGGTFLLGAPNSVNLRKRLTVPFGIGKWSPFEEWYEPEKFRGHVREPDVDDLRAIASDMKLVDVKICGRNWLGYKSRYPLVPKITPLVDALLRPFPSLCSDIYVIGSARR